MPVEDIVTAAVARAMALSDRQREAVFHRGSNVLVEAVPGSGKTRVLVERCVALLDEGVPASQLLLLTFSRRAAGELRFRLSRARLGDMPPDIRTFHGFAARLLADAGDLGRSRRLLSEPAERALFMNVVAQSALSSFPSGVASSPTFRTAAAALMADINRATPASRARLATEASPRLGDLLALAETQRRTRDKLGVADYDELVARALHLAATPGSMLAKALVGRYRHVLVDEFQDTDPLQLALLEQLDAEIFAVGDASQAIYGFRGAARDALALAERRLAMHRLSLDESFRCPQHVCAMARSVVPTAMISGVRDAGTIVYRRAATPQDEAVFLADAIEEELAGGTIASEIAVLVRSAEPLASLVAAELRERGIACARHGGENVLDDLAVDALRTALAAFARPSERIRWVQLFAHAAFAIAPLILALALNGATLDSVEAACAILATIETGAALSGTQLAGAIRAAHALWNENHPVRAAKYIAVHAGILAFAIDGEEAAARRAVGRIESFLEALGDVRDVLARVNADTSSAAVFAAFLECSDDWRAGGEPLGDEPGVRMLTIHAAKGLEFDIVVIADAVEGRFPQRMRADGVLAPHDLALARAAGVDLGTLEREHDDEERSLWYVAVTRSKRKLYVTWSEAGVDGTPQRPSRFIPLEARTSESGRKSFHATLTFVPAPSLHEKQLPGVARLMRPVRTSTMETWLWCRRKFYYDALLRIASDERGYRAKLGTLVHRTIERFHARVRDFRSIHAGAHVAWAATLREIARALVSDPRFDAFDSSLETEAALRATDRMTKRYARELASSARARAGGFEVIATERRLAYDVAGIAFSGSIDRVDRLADGTLALVDIKTGRLKKSMRDAFPKLAAAAANGNLWVKATPPGNPQLPLYRHAEPATSALAYVYLGAESKFGAYTDAARTDELDLAVDSNALADIDHVLVDTFYEPWTSGTLTSLEPTRNARTCRTCEFIAVCPGYREDDDGW